MAIGTNVEASLVCTLVLKEDLKVPEVWAKAINAQQVIAKYSKNYNPVDDVLISLQADSEGVPSGTALTSADLLLRIDEQRPWRIYTGYDNSGSESVGEDRWFTGFNSVIPTVALSVESTKSGTRWTTASHQAVASTSRPVVSLASP